MKNLFFIFSLLIPAVGFAQLDVSLATGVGKYSMSDLKKLQESIRADFPVEAKITSSFPAYWFYEGTVKKRFDNNFMTGGSFSLGSTGGRISYADYSGEIHSDQLVKFYSFAAVLGVSIKSSNQKMIYQFDVHPGITMTNLKIEFAENLNGQTSTDAINFRSINVAFQPTASVTKRFSSIGVHTNIGYHITALHGRLENSDGNYIKDTFSDWSGIRVSLGLTFYFSGLETMK